MITVAFEFVSEIHRETDDLCDGFGIFTVHVKNRNLKHLGDICRVLSRARFIGAGGETDLIVHHHMQRAADGITRKLAQIQRLLHHAFAGKRSIAMNQQYHCSERESSVSRSSCTNPATAGCRGAPNATPFTNSRWLGLKHSASWIFLPPAVVHSELWPR